MFRSGSSTSKRGERVAESFGQLVDFIEHQNRIASTGLVHRLRDVPGQRADVGMSMTANFGFIVHAAQAHAAEFEADGLGDALTERCRRCPAAPQSTGWGCGLRD